MGVSGPRAWLCSLCPFCTNIPAVNLWLDWWGLPFLLNWMNQVAKGTDFCHHLPMIPLLPTYRQKLDSTDGRWLSTVIHQQVTLSPCLAPFLWIQTELRRWCPGALWIVASARLLFPGGKATSSICSEPGPLNKCSILWHPIWLWQSVPFTQTFTYTYEYTGIHIHVHSYLYT